MLFRNRRLLQGTACFLLLETLLTLVAPSVGVAMMGPGQPEFTSYESPGSTDMVNLTTGDMTYNIPILDVPGPERSFSLPLTYRAGIRLEQEASWVGLGWSLNPGAIARGLNGYPDDVSGEYFTSNYRKDVGRGWYGGVPAVLDLAWDSETGHSGTADLIGLASVGWANGKVNSGDLVGVKYTKGEGVTVDPVRMAFAAVTIASLGSAAPATAAAGKAVSTGAKMAAIGAEIGKQVGTGVATGVAMSMLGRASGQGGGFNRPTIKKEKRFLHTNYWVFFNDTKDEVMYGSLYFQDMSTNVSTWANQGESDGPMIYNDAYGTGGRKARVYNYYTNYGSSGNINREVGADLHQEMLPADNGAYLNTSLRPVSVAHDDFSVMGAGISGSIRPYRLEVGSVASPQKGEEQHYKYSVAPFLDDYKVPFRYENSAANGYDYHDQVPAGAPLAGQTVGMSRVGNGNYGDWGNVGLAVTDQRLKSLYSTTLSTAPARKGIHSPTASDPGQRGRGLVQGKHVAWWSNDEILQMYQNSTDGDGRLLEVYYPTARPKKVYQEVGVTQECTSDYGYDERCWDVPVYDTVTTGAMTNNPFRLTLPGKGIGAYSVTAEDGTTYHYSLPVYHYTTFTKSVEKNPTQGSAGVATTRTGSQNGDYAYATTWLLTAITSADYVDRGQQGVVDDADWGGWVKFDYGRFASRYKWRQPYVGTSYTEDDNAHNFMEGSKQTYYLNSIRTRSHTALFVKSARTDARGHFTPSGPSNIYISETTPSSSLRLDEIVLLTNEDLTQLQTENSIRQAGDPTTVPALGVNTGNNAPTADAELRHGDTYRYVIDQHDLADPRIRACINQRALKRVVFNYSYRLCPGTPNSFPSLASLPSMAPARFAEGRQGKLTLESVSTYGPQNTKLLPDFVFRYGSNPNYDPEKWDGFGMYNSQGYAGRNGHAVSSSHATASADGAAWSLTEIISPLGSKTQFTYERDQYAHVSEYGFKSVRFTNTDCSSTLRAQNFSGDLRNYLTPNTTIKVSQGVAEYGGTCDEEVEDPIEGIVRTIQAPYTNKVPYDGVPVTIQEVTASTIVLAPASSPSDPYGTPNGTNCTQSVPLGMTLTVELPETRNGGDLRVAAVTTVDENNHAYQVRYRYADAHAAPLATSTGVISKEPEFVTRIPHAFDHQYDYPATPVMYGQVTVLRGRFADGDQDHDQREEFNFVTPSSEMVRSDAAYAPGYLGYVREGSNNRYVSYANQLNRITVDLGKLGQATAIRRYNQRGDLEFSTRFAFANTLPNTDGIAGQGRFTEGVMTNEMLKRTVYRVNRTTKVYVPTVLRQTTTVANGMRVDTYNDLYDFFTGQVLETRAKNALGDEIITKTVPAYTLAPYAAMGPKSDNGANRNLLTHTAATYVFQRTAAGTTSVLAANVQTWKPDWTYRAYNASADRYEDVTAPAVWRQHETYAWNGLVLNADGTAAGFVDFNWSRLYPGGQAAGWLKLGEATRYDVYSRPLEARDMNGLYAASKAGYGQRQTVASAGNARYTEMAYSGAEDQVLLPNNGMTVDHFSGEVRDGGRRSNAVHHAGDWSSQLGPYQTGFTYRAKAGDAYDVRVNRKYRLSAWVYADGAAGGRLYATLNGVTLGETSVTAPGTKQAGNWYLLNLLVDLPASASGQTLVVGCRNAGGGTVYVDDFRFHPATGPLTAYNYDAHTQQVTYSLNNENLFTHYEYDNAGKLARIYQETLDRPGEPTPAGGRLVQEYRYNYARMKTANWLRTGEITCETNPDGSPNGYRRYRIRDINPQSATYNQLGWEQGEYSGDCAPCNGPLKRWIGGQCEPAGGGRCVTSYANPDQTYTNTYEYTYSDGSHEYQDRTENYPCAMIENPRPAERNAKTATPAATPNRSR